jgi:hypothetical protein
MGRDLQKVIRMQAELRGDMAASDELLQPGYWLAWGLEWPGGSGPAEAVVAFAPSLIPRDGLSYGAQQILGCADVYARKRPGRVVFFSDITRLLTKYGESWDGLGVGWEAALQELEDSPFPGVFLSVSERGHMTLCDPMPGSFLEDRRLVRQALMAQLEADWPGYIQALADKGRLRQAS